MAVTEHSLLIAGALRRGRPRLEPQPCTSVSAWLPEPDYDRLAAVAARRHVSVSSLVKQFIIIQLRDFPTNK
jgi:hypothetical protein